MEFFSRTDSRPYCQVPCREGGGIPQCSIRACAVAKGVRVCFDCGEFPCELLSRILKRRPQHLEDAKQYKQLGMEAWAAAKLDASRRGFVRATGKYYTVKSETE